MSGELAPGDRLPTEGELCDIYGCARMTVSKAISALVAAGLVERRKKAGSFVTRPRVHSMILDVPDIQSEVQARGGRYEFHLLTREIRPADPARPVDAALVERGDLLAITGLHLAEGRPLAVEERLVNVAIVPDILDADLTMMAPGTWLLEHIPWTQAETRISARIADAPLARLLQLDAGAACLVVERRTWRGEDGVTSVRQEFDAQSYDLIARFAPGNRETLAGS